MSCCTSFYARPEVREFMGDCFHPGGEALTRRMLDAMRLSAGTRVLDVACGTGLTTVALARDYGVHAVGLDLGQENLQAARASAQTTGLDLSFVLGEASELPFEDDAFDAVVCECALSTFEDKPKVVSEFARITRSGGRLGLSDMAVYGELPQRLAELAGPWACLQDAQSVEQTQRMLHDAGYQITGYDDESAALHTLALELKRKLVVIGLGRISGLLGTDVDLRELREVIDQARAAVDRGAVQYYRMTASL
ncbi:MAG: class I SAM-dependent methyltransferase [Nannocystaceae bacterium]|nr:class I SAM-dependent methyltransferase [Nannocystaceae bacterium]